MDKADHSGEATGANDPPFPFRSVRVGGTTSTHRYYPGTSITMCPSGARLQTFFRPLAAMNLALDRVPHDCMGQGQQYVACRRDNWWVPLVAHTDITER
jgi:hypothetical protein